VSCPPAAPGAPIARSSARTLRGIDEGHPFPAGEAGGGDRQRVEVAGVEVLADAREVDPPLEQVPQRRRVEQGAWRRQQPAAGQQRQQHRGAGTQHGGRIGAKDPPDPEVAPDAVERGPRRATGTPLAGSQVAGTPARIHGLQGHCCYSSRELRGSR